MQLSIILENEQHTKAEVDYVDKASDKDKQCQACRFFKRPDGCVEVIGKIDPKGWCKLWKK
jgi:hypothetical protein